MPLSAVRFPPGHRHQLLGDAQLLANQTGRRRKRRAHGAGSPQRRPAPRAAEYRSDHAGRQVATTFTARWRPEDDIIVDHRGHQGRYCPRGWLGKALGGADYAEARAALCRRVEVAPGDTIARQGEPSIRCISSSMAEPASWWTSAAATGARTQPRASHDDRRDGSDFGPPAQRHHRGRVGRSVLDRGSSSR